MTYFLFLVAVTIGAFVLGTLEGPRLLADIKTWFVKEEKDVVVKVEHVVGLTGATGPVA